MRVLVAGASGYLGGHVATELAGRGGQVRALVRAEARRPAAATEIFVGDVTAPASLRGACDGVDAVFSSVGITRQRDGLTFRDVDYQANVNLLAAARAAGVRRFVYVSIADAGSPALRDLAIVRAHEDFVAELRAAPIVSTVLRPTGYFSDLEAFLAMARRGRAYVFGGGGSRMNPIDGADLASCAADAIDGDAREIAAGGPEVLTIRAIAELAFAAVGRPARIRSIPTSWMRAATTITRAFSRHTAGLLAFQTAVLTHDLIAPPVGRTTLAAHFRRRQAELSAGATAPAR